MTFIIAHRGYSIRYFENTPKAWRGAVEAGADFVEADIRFTGDGVAVCCHDADLRRLAGRAERVVDLRHHDLAAIRAVVDGLAPDFAELLEAVQPSTGLLLDIKDESPEALERLGELLGATGERDIVLGLHALGSVSALAARGHRRILGLIPKPDDGSAFVDAGASLVRLWEDDASAARLDLMARRNIPVWITTGEGPTGRAVGDHDDASLQQLARAGVEGFLVNDPVGARAALAGAVPEAAR